MKSFEGKVAVITGASSGIGQSLAKQLNVAGTHLALCDLDRDRLFEMLSSLENKSSAISLLTLDVSNQEQMGNYAIEVVEQHGHVDLLINNAGITITPIPFDHLSDELFEEIIATR